MMLDSRGSYGGPDHCTYANAKMLAHRLRDYWFVRGYEVATVIGSEKHGRGTKEMSEFFFVRSDLVNGMPQKQVTTA
jgi:hypothetical protein